MSILKVNPISNINNQLYFYVYNESDSRMWFKCSCRVYDSSGIEVQILPNNNVPNPNTLQEISEKDNKKLSIDLACDIHDDMLFVCEITEQLAKTNSEKSTSKYKFRLTHTWLPIEE